MSQGFIDGVKGPFLLGWVYDPERPDERLEVDVEFDGVPVGRCLADQDRRDLVKLGGYGDGRHGFRVKLPQTLEPDSSHVLLVRSEDGTVLPLVKNYLADPTGSSDARQLTLRVQPPAPAGIGPDGAGAIDGTAPDGDMVDAMSPLAGSARTGPRRALVGAGGWLFPYDGAERLARVLGATDPSPDRARERVRVLRTRNRRLAELGVGYFVVAMPDKAAVYYEELPGGLSLVMEGRPADQLVAALRDDPKLEILDLLSPLRHARQHGQVFLRQGRHVTWTGAFYAYRALLKELVKRFAAIKTPPAELSVGPPVQASDPLSTLERVALIGQDAVTVTSTDDDPELEPELDRASLDAMYVPLPEETAATLGPRAALLERTARDLPRVAIVHDGSGGRLVPFLAEHFSRTLVDVSEALPYQAIEEEKPLLVIQILSEAGSFFA